MVVNSRMALPIICFQLKLPCPVNDPSICLSCLSSTGQVQSLDIPVELNFPVAITVIWGISNHSTFPVYESLSIATECAKHQ